MTTTVWLLVATILALGCARSDWIETGTQAGCPPASERGPRKHLTPEIGAISGASCFGSLAGQPEPLRLKAGVKYRLRFINITPNNNGSQVSLLAGSSPVRWRAVAKDGEDLPPAQAIEQEARLVIAVGKMYDFEFEPTTKGDLRLEVVRLFNRTWAVTGVQVR